MHDSYKMLKLYEYYVKIFLGVCAILIFTVGIVGTVESRFSLIMDYENGSGETVNFSVAILFFSLLVCASIVLPMYIAAPVTAITTVITLMCLCAMDWFTDYGHVPGLDVHYREYDIGSVCWQGVTKNDRNAIKTPNCFTTIDTLEILCAKCRQEYYSGETTFLKSKRLTVALILLIIMFAQLLFLYMFYLKSRSITVTSRTESSNLAEEIQSLANSTNKKINDSPKYSTYVDFKDDEYDDEFDHYDQINKNIYANCVINNGTFDEKQQVARQIEPSQPVYYAVPKNNMPLWKHAQNTFLEITPEKPIASPISLLYNPN